jgi:hypothetical protein
MIIDAMAKFIVANPNRLETARQLVIDWDKIVMGIGQTFCKEITAKLWERAEQERDVIVQCERESGYYINLLRGSWYKYGNPVFCLCLEGIPYSAAYGLWCNTALEEVIRKKQELDECVKDSAPLLAANGFNVSTDDDSGYYCKQNSYDFTNPSYLKRLSDETRQEVVDEYVSLLWNLLKDCSPLIDKMMAVIQT